MYNIVPLDLNIDVVLVSQRSSFTFSGNKRTRVSNLARTYRDRITRSSAILVLLSATITGQYIHHLRSAMCTMWSPIVWPI